MLSAATNRFATIVYFFYNGGQTSGLTADAGGDFHPFWVDNRTGLPQVWTARVTVAGDAIRNGSSELASLEDVTGALAYLTNVVHDRAKGTIAADAKLTNTSKRPLPLPLTARVLGVSSEVGVPEILSSDNAASGEGALWAFGEASPGSAAVLEPGKSTFSRRLVFRLGGGPAVSRRQEVPLRADPRNGADARPAGRVFPRGGPEAAKKGDRP